MATDIHREEGSLLAAGHRLEYAWWHPRVEPGAYARARAEAHAAPATPARAAAPALAPIVLLHEGLGCVALWRDFPVLLARHTGRSVLAYSRYGYGRSDRLEEPRDDGFMHAEAHRALPEVLAHFAIERPLLVGHSDGASIALIYAGTWPERPIALVALAPHLFVEALTVESITAASARFAAGDLPQRMGRYHLDARRSFQGWADVWLSPSFGAWNIEAEVARIACPILAIQGADDEYGTMRQIERIAELHADTRLVALSDCRHSPHIDQPSAVLGHIREFTEQLPAAMSAGGDFH